MLSSPDKIKLSFKLQYLSFQKFPQLIIFNLGFNFLVFAVMMIDCAHLLLCRAWRTSSLSAVLLSSTQPEGKHILQQNPKSN